AGRAVRSRGAPERCAGRLVYVRRAGSVRRGSEAADEPDVEVHAPALAAERDGGVDPEVVEEQAHAGVVMECGRPYGAGSVGGPAAAGIEEHGPAGLHVQIPIPVPIPGVFVGTAARGGGSAEPPVAPVIESEIEVDVQRADVLDLEERKPVTAVPGEEEGAVRIEAGAA